MFQGFLSLGGTEIANSSRFLRYVNELVPGLDVEDCYDCADLGEILGDGPYNSPLVDQPDWYAINQPDSVEFCGFYPLEIEGVDDGTRTASVTELALDGAQIGAPRYASREIKVTGLLVGATDAAVHYGLRWLAKALEGSACRDATGCTGDHLCYYAACPPICEDSPALEGWTPGDPDSCPGPFYLCDDGMVTTVERACSVDYERTLYQVSLTSGPTVVEQYNSTCGHMLRVEFTLVAGVPFAYSTAVSAVPGAADVPIPEQVVEVACTPGTDVVVRTNLATNPIPSGNAAVAGGGWQASGTGFTVTPDTTVGYAGGGGSVRVERTSVVEQPNLAANPDPTTLDGWDWLAGQGPPAADERTNWATNPSFEAAATGTVATPVMATNLNPDPRIVSTAFTAIGGGVAGQTREVVSSGGPDDDSFVRYTWSIDATGNVVYGYGGSLPPGAYATVVPGQEYTGSIWVRFSRAIQVTARLDFRTATLDAITGGAIDSASIAVPADTWTQIYVTGIAPATGERAGVSVVVYAGQNTVAGDVLDFAHRMVTSGGTLWPYFDGQSGSSQLPWGDGHWTGTADASTSVLVPAGAAYPAANQPEAFDVPDTFDGPLTTGVAAVAVQSTYGRVVGTWSTAIVPDGSANSTVAYPAGLFAGATDKLGWELGRTYTISATITLAAPQASTSLLSLARSMRARVAGGTNARLLGQSTAAPNEAGSYRLSMTFTMPDSLDGGNAVLELFNGSNLPSDVVWWDAVLIEEGTAARGYFDGSFPDGGGLDYEWTGDPDASPSTLAVVAPQVDVAVITDPGDGPDGQDTYFRAQVVHEKVGGQDGVIYTMPVGPGAYTVDLQVRASNSVRVQLIVTALDAAGQVLATSQGTMLTLTADDWFPLGPVRLVAPAGTTSLRVAALMPATEILPTAELFDAGALRVYAGTAVNDPLIGRVTYVGQHDDDATTIAVDPGVPITASLYVGASVAALAEVTLTFYTAAGIPVLARTDPGVPVAASPTPLAPATWQRVATSDEVVPAGAAYVVVSVRVAALRLDGAQVGDRAWLSSVLVEETSAVLSYFDGSTDPRGNVTYEWTGTENESTSQALLTLPTDADGGRIVDPDCPPVPEPPRPPLIDVSCVDTPDMWMRYQVAISADLVPQWFDAVPIIRLQTGDSDARQVRVRFYPNPLDAPVAALDPCSFCGEFVVTYIPANSLMTIDGIRQWVTVTNSAGVVSTANHLLASSAGGPVTWPLLGCGVGYTLVVDVSPTAVADLAPQICLAARA